MSSTNFEAEKEKSSSKASDFQSQSPAVSQTVLALICKRPLPGQGKQRLAQQTNQSYAYQVAWHLLQCALEDLQSWEGPVVISPSSQADERWAKDLAPWATVIPQPEEGNLGEKLEHVDREIRKLGRDRVLMIGSDSPVLRNSHLKASAEDLLKHDVVFVPARDGGVVLMGNAKPWPKLKKLPWSENTLRAKLIQSCRKAGYTCSTGALLYDIDGVEDLAMVRDDLARDPRPARHAFFQFLQQEH